MSSGRTSWVSMRIRPDSASTKWICLATSKTGAIRLSHVANAAFIQRNVHAFRVPSTPVLRGNSAKGDLQRPCEIRRHVRVWHIGRIGATDWIKIVAAMRLVGQQFPDSGGLPWHAAAATLRLHGRTEWLRTTQQDDHHYRMTRGFLWPRRGRCWHGFGRALP